MIARALLIVCSAFAVSSAVSTQESLANHLAITNCDKQETQPLAALKDVGNLKCSVATDEKRSKNTYFDNERLTVGDVTVYTGFQGLLNFKGDTPRYCFGDNNKLETFDIDFTSDSPDDVARVELTPCRTGGYWTNGKVFCSPPECSQFLRQPNADYFSVDLSVTVNMADLAEIPDGTSIVKFMGGPDHRVVYNVTSNQTYYYSTKQFLDQCEVDGPCYKGKFLGNDKLLYLTGGRPVMSMKKAGGKVFIGVRYDPRKFIFTGEACSYRTKKDSGSCSSPTGTHSWQKLWERTLPYEKEWLSLEFKTKFSHTQDCEIQVIDGDTKENLVNFKGPCGRYVDMSMGNYPYPKVGVYRGRGSGEVKMRFRDIIINRQGPVTQLNVN